jgi:hypothetical protein
MRDALNEIYRLRALIEWRCTRDDITMIHEPLKADFANLRTAVDALEAAFEAEKDLSNGTGPAGLDSEGLRLHETK